VVTTGDLTLWGHGDEIRGYRRYYEHKPGDASTLRFPVFDGLGNHDYDNAFYNRSFRIMPYMRAKFAGSPDIRSLHLPSLNYSWDWGDVHFVQTHRFAGDKASHESSLAWLQKDLRERVGSSGRPVVIFAHYGYDSFSREPRWWKDEDRRALAEVLRGYNVLAYIHGHVHGPWMGAMDPAPGRAVPSIAVGRGGQWGTGYFLAVRITERFIDIARATWEDPAEWAPVPDGTPGASCNEEKKDCRKAQPRPTTFPSITQGPSAYPAPRIEAVHTARIGGWKPGR
jgi:cytolysin (calcineurin-like family phosphatase)